MRSAATLAARHAVEPRAVVDVREVDRRLGLFRSHAIRNDRRTLAPRDGTGSSSAWPGSSWINTMLSKTSTRYSPQFELGEGLQAARKYFSLSGQGCRNFGHDASTS
jgi:hypothetical protein